LKVENALEVERKAGGTITTLGDLAVTSPQYRTEQEGHCRVFVGLRCDGVVRGTKNDHCITI